MRSKFMPLVGYVARVALQLLVDAVLVETPPPARPASEAAGGWHLELDHFAGQLVDTLARSAESVAGCGPRINNAASLAPPGDESGPTQDR
jgi:hypothetical protein